MAKKDFEIPQGKLVTMLLNGVETEFVPGSDTAEYYFTDKFETRPCSYGERGIDDYRAAICVGPDGIIPGMSVLPAAVSGVVGETGADGITVSSTSHDFSALILNGGTYALKNSKLSFITKSDGSRVSDFTGYGSLVAAFNRSKVTLENCEIESYGVAKPAIYCDDESDGLIVNCKCKVMGGQTYEGYPNTADCKIMVAPPWVLGITGTARGTNEMGKHPSLTIVDSDMNANQWGVLSTDGGEDMYLAVVDSDLTLHGDNVSDNDKRNPYFRRYGSGYGTYIIGGATEDFHGVSFRVGTYGSICRGGTATYKSSNGHITSVSPTTGEIVWEGDGKGRVTTIESDAFGFMAHGDGTFNVIDGTVVSSDNATFLIKAGGVTMNVDNAHLNPGDGVLVQVMDDDDAIVGVDWSQKWMLYFNTEFNEKEGWPSVNGQITSLMPPPPPPPPMPMPDGFDPDDIDFGEPQFDVHFNASNIALKGDILNGTGYFGQKAKQLYVVLGAGAILDGAVSSTEVMHVNENGGQNTHFTLNEYYYLGHLANRPYFNGDNTTEVTLKDGAVWNVTAPGVINALTVGEGCVLNGKVKLDGSDIAVEPGREYRGSIEVIPA